MHKNWQKNVSLFLGSQIISLLGSSLVQYAITWYITRTTQSGIYVTLSLLFGFLPSFFLSPFAGVWADRYNRKKIIIFADGGIALTTLILAFFVMAGQKQLWLLLLASAVRSVGGALQSPAVGAILPDIVPQEQLTRVGGINQSAQSILMLGSPMLASLLLDLPVREPLVYIFFIDVITATIAILIMSRLHITPRVAREDLPKQGYLQDLKAGLYYVWSQSYLKRFFAFCTLFYVLMGPPAFLTQLQVVRTFGDEYWRLSWIEAAFSFGMLLGGLLMATWGGMKNRVHTMVLASFIMGLCTIALGLPTQFVVYNVFMALFGLAMPILNTPATVLLQEKVEPALLGRVFGVMSMLSSSVMPLGMLVWGPLADKVPIENLLIICGALMAAGCLGMLGSRTLVKAGRPLPPKQEATIA